MLIYMLHASLFNVDAHSNCLIIFDVKQMTIVSIFKADVHRHCLKFNGGIFIEIKIALIIR